MTADRSPVRAGRLRQLLQENLSQQQENLSQQPASPGEAGWTCAVVAQTGSTNADLAAAARSGAAEGTALLAESQTAGRGRLGREWRSPVGAGLMLSVLLRPRSDQSTWGWLALMTGVALADAVRDLASVDAGLKWPNDLLIGGRKCAGVLAEVADADAVVVGIGLNVSQSEDELPAGPTGLPATSLLLEQATVLDRAELAARLLSELHRRYRQWVASGFDAVRSGLRQDYLDRCHTLGRQVKVLLAGGGELIGTARTVDDSGRLVVDVAGKDRIVAAGDVLHLR